MSEEEPPKGAQRQSLESAVFRALGQASVCWSEKPSGSLDFVRVVQIGDNLLEEIERYCKRRSEEDDGNQ